MGGGSHGKLGSPLGNYDHKKPSSAAWSGLGPIISPAQLVTVGRGGQKTRDQSQPFLNKNNCVLLYQADSYRPLGWVLMSRQVGWEIPTWSEGHDDESLFWSGIRRERSHDVWMCHRRQDGCFVLRVGFVYTKLIAFDCDELASKLMNPFADNTKRPFANASSNFEILWNVVESIRERQHQARS